MLADPVKLNRPGSRSSGQQQPAISDWGSKQLL